MVIILWETVIFLDPELPFWVFIQTWVATTSGIVGLKGNVSETWTPVVKRKRRRSSASSTGASSSSSELDVSCSRKVQYQERNGAPGLSIHRRNVKWTPVIPSPVASRTRSRTIRTNV